MKSIEVQFATNRNPVPAPVLFGNDFRNKDDHSEYVTGSIRVKKTSDKPDSGWTPDPKTLQLESTTNEGVESVAEAAEEAATAPADNGIVAFAKRQQQVEKGAAAPPASGAGPGYGLVLLPGFASTF